MVIDISLELLNKLKLNPNEFFFMELLKKKEYKIAEDFLKNNYTREEATNLWNKLVGLEYFTSNSYLENNYGYKNVKVSNLYRGLTKTDDMFDEFVEEYPKSVTRSDGTTDYLRTDLKSAKMFYLKATRGLRAGHEHIIACLKFEVEERMKDGSIKFMPRITKWLNTQGWNAYEDRLSDSMNNNVGLSTKYGTEIE